MSSLSTTRQREETTDDNSTTTKKVKREEEEEIPPLQPLLLNRKDIWLGNILPFLGIGNYIFVAGVCKDMKELYQDYYSSISKDELPRVDPPNYMRRKALSTDTFYREAFASLSRAKFWDENTKHKADRLRDDYICLTIAQYGNLEVLKWAHKQRGFPWDAWTCREAARAGRFDIVKYAHENGCPWDEDTCSAAAREGRLDILRYAHENGCPWDKYTCYVAAISGWLDTLRYAHENGCPWDSYILAVAIRKGHKQIVEYARANGCPEPPPNENDN